MSAPRFSVVVPVHNEQEDVTELASRVSAVLEGVGGGYEILFIDDGSTDDTWNVLKTLADPDRIRLIKFRRNFGKAAALMAGFEATRGEIVFTMDGDLQDDPAEIPRFLEKLDEGFDIVSGWKKVRHDPAGKVIPSRIFNYVVRKMTKVGLHDMNCGFKCYRGEAARSVRIYGELHRYIPALLAQQGFRSSEIVVQHHPRVHGQSKYGLSRLFKGFVDLGTVMLTGPYGARPAHGFGWMALIAMALGLATGALGGLLTLFGVGYGLGMILLLKALFFSLSSVILFAAGWTAEIAAAGRLRENPAALYRIEERVG